MKPFFVCFRVLNTLDLVKGGFWTFWEGRGENFWICREGRGVLSFLFFWKIKVIDVIHER